MKIELCLGSSCHVKGSKTILALLEKNIEKYRLGDKVEIVGTLCLGECKADGANMRIDGEVVTGINEANFDEFFRTRVIDVLNK